jgi:hypothetical protein
LTADEIAKWIDDLGKESNAIRREALTLSWYMRGGISYNDAMHLSFDERTLINEIVNANLETTKKSGLPFF